MAKIKVGDAIVVKPGVNDPDTGQELGGYQGRVTEVEADEEGHTLVTIQWDSLTLKDIPHDVLAYCEREGLDWSVMCLYAEEVEASEPRGQPRDAARVIKEIEGRVGWLYLGDEGKLIQQVLMDIPHGNDWKAMQAWFRYLKQALSFPFEAEVAEFQERGPIRAGDRLKVIGIEDLDDLYGVLVNVIMKRDQFVFPLCDLEVHQASSPNFAVLRAYVVWFANR